MSNTEILPPDLQLENLVKRDLEDLFPVLDEHYSANHQSFVQLHIELQDARILGYIDELADILCDSGASPETIRIFYESFFFAFTLSDYILPCPTSVVDHEFYRSVGSDNFKQKIISDANRYLSLRPTLEKCIAAYLSMIDASGFTGGIARIVVGTTFMNIENGNLDKYLEQQTKEFAGFEEDFGLITDK